MEKWKERVLGGEDVDVELMHWLPQQTAVWSWKKTDEMSFAELMMLYHIVQMIRSHPLVIIDAHGAQRTGAVLRHEADCNVYRAINGASVIYSCNGEPENLTFQLGSNFQMEKLSFSEDENVKSYWMKGIFASAAGHQHHTHSAHKPHAVHHDPHQHHAFVKHQKKRVNRKKYELLKLRRKREALERIQKEAPDILKLPMARRKLLCKYRKSCYETGVVPETWNIRNIIPRFLQPKKEPKPETLATIDNETKEEISESELKLLCRYRKSCYQEVGAEIERLYENIHIVPMLARRSPIALPPKRHKTIEEIARIALAKVEEKEKLAAQRPLPKKVIIDKKLNEIDEQMRKRLACKYRKSCYETGILPEHFPGAFYNPLPRLYKFIQQKILRRRAKERIHREFNDLEENEKKLYCKYRKSCYATGEKPVIEPGQMFQYVHIVKLHEELVPLEIRCKYRKSCYESGNLPELGSKKPEIQKTPSPIQKITTLYGLKLSCKYRKSCYRRKAQEPQNASAELFEELAKLGQVEAKAEKQKAQKEQPVPPKKPIKLREVVE
ncbi:unnamed protein product, partial [Gongylonema pulchrum]|uniref:28S ribosomal protein S15, mitochondrial n=1 Tax=Gongylonema pulchrum TaxID=637853 RepID=A0A183EHG5_9BILA